MPKSTIPQLATITQGATLFTAFDGQAFIRLPVPTSGGFYIHALHSRAFRHWFFYEFYNRFDTLPTPQAFRAFLTLLEAQANLTSGERFTVDRRVSALGPRAALEKIYLDLADPHAHYVEISPGAWKVTAGSGVLFDASRSTISLPAPVPADAAVPSPLDTLRSCFNLPSRDAWLRCLAWLVAALRPSGPFPVLILRGPTGSGKSFAAHLLRSVVDPCTAPLSPIPSNVSGLHLVARHNWILALDHLSSLSPSLTDALCRLSSGVGTSISETAGRDPEPLQHYYRRPVILTVTDGWSCPAPLAERALVVDLPHLPPECRRPETAIVTEFENAWPAILGALCTAVAGGLRRLSETRPPAGRCADALSWAMAASPDLGATPEDMRQAFDPPSPPHPIVEAVQNLLDQRRRWSGTATELCDLLGPAHFSATPRVVSHQLRSCLLTFADAGIELKFRRLPGKGERIIDLREEPCDANLSEDPEFASQNSAQSPQVTEPEEVNS